LIDLLIVNAPCHARGEGLTSAANPCAGIKGFREEGRDTSPDDALLQRVLDATDRPLGFAMCLAELTGQRPTDVRTMPRGRSAGVSFQFRDLRAKVAIDADEANGIRAAQAILGHTTEAMTAHYIRHKVGKKVRPVR
jgi:hypothetical protein